jgi:predicted secreted protein
MAAINGDEILLIIGSTTVTGQISGSLNLEQNMIDTTTKDSLKWETSIPGTRNWSIDVECVHDPSGTYSTDEVLAQIIGGNTAATVKFGETGSGEEYWTGSAYIDTAPLDAPHNDRVGISFTLKGTGALAKATVGS